MSLLVSAATAPRTITFALGQKTEIVKQLCNRLVLEVDDDGIVLIFMEKLKIVLCRSILMLAVASDGALALGPSPKAAPPSFAALKGVDVGSPEQPGQTVITNNSAEVGAGGRDIGGTADQFHFSYTEVAGDF